MIDVEDIDKYITGILQERFQKNIDFIEKEFREHKEEIVKEFIVTIHILFQNCIKKQEGKLKNKIAIIHMCYLECSCLMKDIEIQINLYDSQFYLDRCNIYGIWKPAFIYKYYHSDMNYIELWANENVKGFCYSTLQKIRLKVVRDYHIITYKFICSMVDHIIRDELFQDILKEDEVLIAFGGYMDSAYPVAKVQCNVGEENEIFFSERR